MNFRLIHSVLFAFIILLIGSCQPSKDAEVVLPKGPKHFFDLRGFVNERIETYVDTDQKVNKQVVLNGNAERQENMSIEWAKELRPIVEADINRSAWLDAFSTDTVTVDNETTITYRSDDNRIPIRQMSVTLGMSGEIISIDAVTRRKNLLYTSEQELSFQPDVSYSVEGWQRTLFLSKTEFEVSAQLLN